jgi:thioredoxin reductase (NADPH)
MPSMKLTLLSRSCCHLCSDMEEALAPLADEFGVEVEVLDVDDHPALLEVYDELVPVLLHDGAELCHYFLDVGKVRDHLHSMRQYIPRQPPTSPSASGS